VWQNNPPGACRFGVDLPQPTDARLVAEQERMMKRGETAFGIQMCRTWLVLPSLLFSLGCGDPKGEISGKVTYQDKPIPGGTVTFFGAEDRVVGSAPISAEGIYSVAKVPAGPVKITVTAPTIVTRDPKAPPLSPLPTGKGTARRKAIEKRERDMWESNIRMDIPAKYSMPDQSGLTYTVQPGKQEYPIELK
jgi:hypothetical protein